MGRFISKEDILVEIAVLFKQMDNGQLTIDELEELVKLSSDLHERTVILRYKAFEEKVFGTKSVSVDVPTMQEEINIPDPVIETPAPSIPVIEASAFSIEPETEIEEEDAPLFKVEVKDEPSFGFSLFGNEIEEKSEQNQIVEEKSIYSEPSNIEENNSFFNSEISSTEKPAEVRQESIPSERPMSDVERAHAENLARFLNKSREERMATEDSNRIEPVAPSPSAPQFEKVDSFFTPKIEPIKEIQPEPEMEEPLFQQREEFPEPIKEVVIPVATSEESVGEPSSYSYGDLAAYIHKYNLVDSSLASQFGVTKIASLVGSFGLNERLQFINELFDGSSENFSNAIKILDQQSSSENARTKIAELGASNSWDVESETVVEFMQKVIRRYA